MYLGGIFFIYWRDRISRNMLELSKSQIDFPQSSKDSCSFWIFTRTSQLWPRRERPHTKFYKKIPMFARNFLGFCLNLKLTSCIPSVFHSHYSFSPPAWTRPSLPWESWSRLSRLIENYPRLRRWGQFHFIHCLSLPRHHSIYDLFHTQKTIPT